MGGASSQAASVRDCAQMVRMYEGERSITYDLVARVRSDMAFVRLFPPLAYFANA